MQGPAPGSTTTGRPGREEDTPCAPTDKEDRGALSKR